MSVRNVVGSLFSVPVAEAHCDGPCGIYDPASARVAAEAVLSMNKKMLDLHAPESSDAVAVANYVNTMSRFVTIKEEQAELTKRELLVLWTDYFKPVHLEAYPDLHTTFWNAAKLCSDAKQHVDVSVGEKLLAAVEEIHNIFWQTKGRDVAWVTAG